MENLTILLDDDNLSYGSIVDLPTNKDVTAALALARDGEKSAPQPAALNINELCVVVWLDAKAKYEWFIGYVTAVSNSIYTVDHLHRKQKSLDTEWKYPFTEDILEAGEEQIVRCSVKGEWDITPDKRKRVFVLNNRNEILDAVKSHVC